VQDRPKYSGINPYGMEYIPSATFHIGQTDQISSIVTCSVRLQYLLWVSLWMILKITNNEYRQFVNWVRDSIAHTMLDHFIEDDQGIRELIGIMKSTGQMRHLMICISRVMMYLSTQKN
jgi:hypothetical protein